MVAHRLAPLDKALAAHVLEHPVIGLDQTSWSRLESADSKPWQMWCLTVPGVVVHRIRDDKSAASFASLVGRYNCTIDTVLETAKLHDVNPAGYLHAAIVAADASR